ncbi:acetate kinase [Mycoplasmopsis californica]|uniref:Acetate kinase n=1 Tax=Mycoplasmopsis equigenitalium TaxID=114883 RepID=A0ABY5J1A1_9BACT|nr:acetate/propionate family kinase [Mycoplasmopsis equigenitalium]UUD37019.1 acetate/propionate family kinase [Mycoplasmopsis equigenitalium]VEU69682.1 acetate kinase [Mycoplasmopsis californica]
MSKILVINAGSSSIKLALFEKQDYKLISSGLAERITLPMGNISIKFNGEKIEKDVVMPNHKVAVEHILQMLSEHKIIKDAKEIEYIGFRVVQGGPYFDKASKLGEKEIKLVEKASIYAPLHNPGAVQAMWAFKEVMPKAKMSVNFDTAFHTTINKVNNTYPIPKELSEKYGVKKYGAHGISHRYVTLTLQKILNKDKVNFVNLHIGNGASLCAIKDSKSFDTSMGLTPLAGIMMGTRSGDIDPSIHEFIMNQSGMNIQEFTNALNKKSGLLGVSGISSDMRDVQSAAKKGDKNALFALDLYAQKIADYTAIYANKIGGNPDAIVFTAGIGENVASVRQNVIDRLHFKNIKLDHEVNTSGVKGGYTLISTPDSEVKVYVIPTNEELLIAKDAIKLYS